MRNQSINYGAFASIALAAVTFTTAAASAGIDRAQQAAIDRLLDSNRTLAVMNDLEGNLSRIYGGRASNGSSPLDSAERFLENHAAALGVRAGSLSTHDEHLSIPHVQPLVFDEQRGTYRFTLISYAQTSNGLPVLDSRLGILVRNQEGFPAVLVSSSLKPSAEDLAQPRARFVQDPVWLAEAIAELDGFTSVEQTRAAIYVDTSTGGAVQVVETIFSRGDPNLPGYERFTMVLDAETGAEIARRSEVHHYNEPGTDLRSGTVTGYATPDGSAALCSPAVELAIPYAGVESDGVGVLFTDINGEFSFSEPLAEGAVVTSTLRGVYFQVSSAVSTDSQPSFAASTSTPISLLHNPGITDEYSTAEVNAYLALNEIRDRVLRVNPAYPRLANERDFQVTVNSGTSCNAFYSGNSIRFTRSSNCENFATRSVAFHEYGHHLVQVGGAVQEDYGEGVGDTVSLILTRDPILGRGVFGDCGSGIRDADEVVMQPCSDEIHQCGLVLVGSVWQTRLNMLALSADDPTDTLLSLMVDSIPLHTGSRISRQIVIDWLTLDDDNADLSDGTPHYSSITPGFGSRKLRAPQSICPWDYDRDGFLTETDLRNFVDSFLSASPRADFNKDGWHDMGDIGLFVSGYLAGCG
ncbi:MAG: hypothetical protein ACI89L_001096 [Phycisphaerales bacterium]|jgi:hypothetical protein